MPAEVFENINPNDPRTEGEEKLLDFFRNSKRFDGWKVFEQVHINSMKPDFILLHPERGIIVIEVKDWKLNSSVYVNGGYILGQNQMVIDKNPVKQVEGYKSLLIKLDLETTADLVERYAQYYGCIETVVYFHGVSKIQAVNYCGYSKNTKIWTDEDLDIIDNPNIKLKPQDYTYALAFKKSKFSDNGLLQRLVDELEKICSYSDYRYERREPFKLTSKQKELAALHKGSIRRWGGVAGAGKSLILAEKAVNALKAEKRVLMLTFNITLRHYLRDLCSQQFGVGNRRKLRTI